MHSPHHRSNRVWAKGAVLFLSKRVGLHDALPAGQGIRRDGCRDLVDPIHPGRCDGFWLLG